MAATFEDQLEKIPGIRNLVTFLKNTKLRAFEGLSLYHLLRLYTGGLVKGALSTRASAIAFNLFMALFPLLIFLVTLVPFVIPMVSLGNESFDAQLLAFLESFLPSATSDYFSEVYQQIKGQKHGGLLSSSFLISIILVANGINAIFEGFETSYHVGHNRKFLKQYAYAFMVGIVLSILLIIGAVASVYFEVYILQNTETYLKWTLGYGANLWNTLGAEMAKILFFGLLSYLATAILYYFGTAEGRKARFFSIGALFTTLLFLLTSHLFGVYVEKFASYNELYGALGGLLILMVFIWLNANILLLGFELNATLTMVKKKQEKPLGEGAKS